MKGKGWRAFGPTLSGNWSAPNVRARCCWRSWALSAIHYVAPVGEKRDFVERALKKARAGGAIPGR